MRKFLSLITAVLLSSISTLSSIACNLKRTYFDDRTEIQLEDAQAILTNNLTLNPNKHVLLLGLDGVPYANLDPTIITASRFRANFYIQGYETIKGWTSVLWGNILQKEKNIFSIIKDNNSNLKTANITQWMGSYYYDNIYGSQTINYFDYNQDFASESDPTNYDTISKMDAQISKLKDLTTQRITDNYNFIFSYNTYYDELKHKRYADNDPLILNLIKNYKDFITNFYNSLDSSQWLVIAVTDHGRDINNNNFNHPDNALSSHFSWTLSNHDLSSILNYSFTNLYDIRTVAIKWLLQ